MLGEFLKTAENSYSNILKLMGCQFMILSQTTAGAGMIGTWPVKAI
jgi:hypothetical protein